MMFRKVTPEKVIRFTTICARLGGCLPPSSSAKNSEIMRYEIYWWFCLCLSLSIDLPVMYDLYLNRGDINSILFDIAELCPLCTGTLKLFLCKYNGETLQACLLEVESYLRTVTVRERETLQSYVDRCIGFHYFIIFCVICTGIGFSCSPMFLPQPYPTQSSYPFEVNTELLKNILRFLQMVAIGQTGILVLTDFQFSILIWFTAARFEILSDELQEVSSTEQLYMCIKKHQEILRFAEDVNSASHFVAYGVAFSTSFGTVTGAIQFLRDVSLIVKMQFVSFVAVGAFELLVYSWPAENLMKTSGAIRFAIYSSQWIDQSAEVKKLIWIVMQRAKKPAIISIGEFAPILSLNFYGSFLSTSFSYFTTLRATTTQAPPST